MTSRTLVLALAVAAGCGSSKAENPPAQATPAAAKPAETSPAQAAPVQAKPVEAKPTKCGDGKLTWQQSAHREQEFATMFCKDDGTAAIQYKVVFQGEVQRQNNVPLSIDQWNEIWRLADAASWQTATIECAPKTPDDDDVHPTTQTIKVFRAGTERSSNCEGSDVSGAWQPLARAMWKLQPARPAE